MITHAHILKQNVEEYYLSYEDTETLLNTIMTKESKCGSTTISICNEDKHHRLFFSMHKHKEKLIEKLEENGYKIQMSLFGRFEISWE